MEGFTYHNIFETKGIEYIFVILFLAVLVPFWLALNRKSKRLKLVNEAFSISIDKLRIPQGVFFGPNHTWMHMNKTGSAKIGLDDMLMHAAGLVNINYLIDPGTTVTKGEIIAEIEHEGNKLHILSPISGEVQRINSSLRKHPEYMNNQPFSDGWILELRPDKWINETKACVLGDKASNWMKDELQRFKDFVTTKAFTPDPGKSIMVLQDGGELMDHTLQKLPASLWKDFQDDFLSLSS